MKTAHAIALVLFGVVAGQIGTSLFVGRESMAQAPALPVPPATQFQISAYGGFNGSEVVGGYYALNVTTGDLWHSRPNGRPERVYRLNDLVRR